MIRKLRLLAILSVLTLAPAAQVLANGYLLLGAGTSKDDVLDESATGIKIGVGANLNKNIAVEAAFVDLGTIDFPGVEFSQYGLAASVIPTLQVNDNVALFAKLGLFSWTFEVNSIIGSGEDTGTDPFIGFGVEFKANAKMAVVVEYEGYEVSDGDVSLLSVGARIGF